MRNSHRLLQMYVFTLATVNVRPLISSFKALELSLLTTSSILALVALLTNILIFSDSLTVGVTLVCQLVAQGTAYTAEAPP